MLKYVVYTEVYRKNRKPDEELKERKVLQSDKVIIKGYFKKPSDAKGFADRLNLHEPPQISGREAQVGMMEGTKIKSLLNHTT